MVSERRSYAVAGIMEDPVRCSVIIIGAGTAGITAAKVLALNGVENVVILKAADKIGGRIRKDEFDGVTVELGAGWIADVGGKQSNPVWELARRCDLRTCFSDYSDVRHNIYDRSGKIFSIGIAADSYKKAVDSAIQKLSSQQANHDATVSESSNLPETLSIPKTSIELAIDLDEPTRVLPESVPQRNSINRAHRSLNSDDLGISSEQLNKPISLLQSQAMERITTTQSRNKSIRSIASPISIGNDSAEESEFGAADLHSRSAEEGDPRSSSVSRITRSPIQATSIAVPQKNMFTQRNHNPEDLENPHTPCRSKKAAMAAAIGAPKLAPYTYAGESNDGCAHRAARFKNLSFASSNLSSDKLVSLVSRRCSRSGGKSSERCNAPIIVSPKAVSDSATTLCPSIHKN